MSVRGVSAAGVLVTPKSSTDIIFGYHSSITNESYSNYF